MKTVISKIAVIPAYADVIRSMLISINSCLRKDGMNIKRNAERNVIKLIAATLRDTSIPIPISPITLRHVNGKIANREIHIVVSGM